MRQLNSLGHVLSADISSAVVTSKHLKNDQHQHPRGKSNKKNAKPKDEYKKDTILMPEMVTERRSGQERRMSEKERRNRWIESRQEHDRRKTNQPAKVNLVI